MSRTSIAVVVVCITSTVAAAQPRRQRAASTAACAGAEKQRAQADQFVAEGLFERAIEVYQAAFEACSTTRFRAAMVFNIGLAYKKRAEQPIEASSPREALELRKRAIEDRRQALTRFRDFLSWIPNGKLSNEARSYVFRLEGDITKQEALVAAEARQLAEAEERQRRLDEQQRRLDEARRRAALRRRNLRISSIAVAGFGVAAGGVGAYYGWQAHSLSKELSRVEDWTPQADAKVAAGERAETRMIVFTAIGGAAAATAGILYWYTRKDRARWEAFRPTVVSITSSSLGFAWGF